MKNIKYFVLTILSFFAVSPTYALSCTNAVSKDLSEIASHVKTGVEVVDNSQIKELVIGEDKTTYRIPNYKFNISIYNITDDIYLTLKDDIYNEEINIYKSDANGGTYKFVNTDFGQIYNYTIEIKSANPDCYGEKIKTIKYTKPKYNAYSEYTYCKTSSSLYCQKFVTSNLKIKNTDDFLSKIKVNNEKNKPEEEEEIVIDNIKSYWRVYLGIFIGVIFISIGVILIIRRKNAKKGWNL